MSKIIVTIDSKYNIKTKDLERQELLDLKLEFSKANPSYFKTRSMGYPTKGIPKNIILYKTTKDSIGLPRGSFGRIKLLLPNYKIKKLDLRTEKSLEKKIEFNEDFKFWSQQKEAIDIAVEKEQGLIHGVCGSGKTEILLGIFAKLQQRTLVIVDTLDLLKQWVERAKHRFKNINIEKIGGGKFGIGDITIASQKTVLNHVDKLKDKFGLVLCDEVHHFAAPTFDKVISEISARYRIGATATLKRKDGKEFIFYSAFGEVLYQITDADLLEDNKIFEVEFVVVPTEFECVDYVDIETELDGEEIVVGYNYHVLLRQMKLNKKRNDKILSILVKEIKRGHKCIVMADVISHCIYFQNLLKKKNIKSMLMVGEEGFEDQRENAPDKLLSGEIDCIIASKVVQEGFDLPILDRGFIINPSANNEARIQQQVGRLKRKAEGKTSARCYYFWDRNIRNFTNHLTKLKRKFKGLKFYVERKNKKHKKKK